MCDIILIKMILLEQPCNYYGHGAEIIPAVQQVLLCLVGGDNNNR
jgi:hypothetical protein